jgi:glutathione peroxidase
MSGVGVAAFFGSKAAAEDGIYSYTVTDIDGKSVPLSKFKGKALLIVNSASACGFTPQQKGLADLAKKFKGNLEIVLQPCNQFGAQDPGSNSEIKKFAAGNGVGVGGAGILLTKADVNGPDATPLYQYLKKEKGGLLNADIKWNFSKFLVDASGKVVGRYPPTTTPESLVGDITKAIAA